MLFRAWQVNAIAFNTAATDDLSPNDLPPYNATYVYLLVNCFTCLTDFLLLLDLNTQDPRADTPYQVISPLASSCLSPQNSLNCSISHENLVSSVPGFQNS